METFWYRLTQVYLEKMPVKMEREMFSAYITVAQFGHVHRQKLYRNDGQNSLQTVHLVWNFNRLVCKLFNLVVVRVAYYNRVALQKLVYM